MNPARLSSVIFLFVPTLSHACGGVPTSVDLAILVGILILMTPAFLVPLAGMLALRPAGSKFQYWPFVIYALAAQAAPVATVLFRESDRVTLPLTLVCLVSLVAPSIHYFVEAIRHQRLASASGAA